MVGCILVILLIIFSFFLLAGGFAFLLSGFDYELWNNCILPLIVALGIMISGVFAYWVCMISISTYRAKKQVQKEKLSNADTKNIGEYYREILALKSPLLIGMLDNYEILLKDFAAELLYLKAHDVIEIRESDIIVLDENTKELDEIEKYIVNNIKKNGKINVNLNVIKKIVSKKLVKLRLFKLIPEKGKLGRLKLISIISAFIISCIAFYLVFVTSNPTFLVYLCIIIVSISFYYKFYKSAYRDEEKLIPYKRTANGEIMNKKIEGLKNYTKDYGLLGEKEAKEVELWGDYLIYSVIWGQNRKIVEEYKKYIIIKEEN